MSPTKLQLVNGDLDQLLASSGLEAWPPQLVPVLGGSYVLPVTRGLSVTWKKTKAHENR